MEALLFLGMMGSGYVYNNITKQSESKTISNPVKNVAISDIVQKNSVYDKNNTLNQPRYIKHKNNQASQFKQYNIDTNQAILKQDELQQINNTSKVQSEISDDYINQMDFLTNDKGIRIQPYFRGSGPGNSDINNNSRLEMSQGYDMKPKKSETVPMFAPQKNTGTVFGTTFDGDIADKTRYDINKYKSSELPFEQIHVSPIDKKSAIIGDISRLDSDRRSTQNIRTLSNQKDTYEGRVIPGSYISQRGEQATVEKYRPYRDYENTPSRNFTTVGETEGPTSRAEEILKPTNRTYLNKSEFGISSSNGLEEPTKRPLVQKTKKTALGTSTDRNAAYEVTSLIDYNKLGYVARPNERQVTVERTYDSNLKSYINNPELGYQDKQKTTKRQTTMYSDSRNPASFVPEDTSRLNFCNMETDPTKEIITKEREPTLSNVKLTNGADQVNMDIKKLDSDYITQHGPGINNVYGKIPTDFKCQLTQDKDTLDNKSIADRIYPEQLDAFRNNPLTQPLSSYAYN